MAFMSKKRKILDGQQASVKKTKIPDTLESDKFENEDNKQETSCKPYLPEKYNILYNQFCKLDEHLGMFHQKHPKQRFEEAQRYVERSTSYQFKEYQLSIILSFYPESYSVERKKKTSEDKFELYLWISDYDKIPKFQLMSKEVPMRKAKFKNILINYLNEKNKEYCDSNNMECLTNLWNPFFKADEVSFPEPFKLPQIPKPSLKPSIEKSMINLEEEIKEEEKNAKDKIEIPELLKDYSEEFKQKYIQEQLRKRCNERFAARRKEKEDNDSLLKIMDIIHNVVMNGEEAIYINNLRIQILGKLGHSKTADLIQKKVFELCELLPEWGRIITVNGRQYFTHIYKNTDKRNEITPREKLMKIIKERNDKLN